jgi:hypothetical protein
MKRQYQLQIHKGPPKLLPRRFIETVSLDDTIGDMFSTICTVIHANWGDSYPFVMTIDSKQDEEQMGEVEVLVEETV